MGRLDSMVGSGEGGKTSTLTKALLLMLAAKAASSYFGGKPGTASARAGSGSPAPAPSGKIESGILAGLPSLDSMLDHFRSKGHDETVQSWIGSGANKPIAPKDVESTLGQDAIDHLQKESGLPRDELLRQLSTTLPQVVDKLTPQGRMPTPDERARW